MLEAPYNMRILSSGALVVNNSGEYLFEIKPHDYTKNPNGIALFGGLLEDNETPIECLMREIQEELGINLKAQNVRITLLGYERSKRSDAYHARYLVDGVDDANITLSDESADILRIKNLDEIYTLTNYNLTHHNGVLFAVHALRHKQYNKDIQGWCKRHIELEQIYIDPPYFKEREIWWIEAGVNVGYEQDGKGASYMRPVLVFKKFNKYLFLGIPQTTAKKRGAYAFEYKYKDDIRTLLLSQMRVYSSKRLKKKHAVLQDAVFTSVDKAVSKMLTHSLGT